MRLFIAIELSNDIHEILAQIQSHLKYAGDDVKWVEKDNIHLTLKFLGEVHEEMIPKIKSILDEIGHSTKPFELALKTSEKGSDPCFQKGSDPFYIGAFPSINNPRVLWVGLERGAKESIQLAGRIDEELSKIGFQKETRPFAAHLTLGRVRSPKNREALVEKMKNTTIAGFGFRDSGFEKKEIASSIILYQSTLTPRGSIYTKLYEAKFVQIS